MNKKLRYSLIAFGFVVFLILAPLIVFYVRGLSFDFTKGQFVPTGILAVKAEPKDAQIFLDNKLASQTVKDIQFLPEKEYDVKLEKTGYQTWQKRLQILGGQIVWASPPTGKIFLFFSAPKNSKLADGVFDFFLSDNTNRIGFLTGNSLVMRSFDNSQTDTVLILPKTADRLISSNDYQKLIAINSAPNSKTAIYLDTKTQEVIDLSNIFSGEVQWLFDGDNNLYGLSDNILYSIDPKNLSKKSIQANVQTAAFLGKDLYFLKQLKTSSSLQVAPNTVKDGQDLLTGLPLFNKAAIAISFEKQIYIFADGSIYRVGGQLETLAKDATSWNFNYSESSLVFFHGGELDYVNPFNQSSELITRRGNGLSSPVLKFAMNNCFFVENNQIKTIELDTRDHQNEFGLYQGKNIKKIAVSGDGYNILVLDGQQLSLVNIR